MYEGKNPILRLADVLEGLESKGFDSNTKEAHGIDGCERNGPVIPMPKHGDHDEKDTLEALRRRLMVKPSVEFHSRFDLGATIGHGSFGKVKKATDRHTGDLVAIKLFTSRPGSEGQLRQFFQECDILKSLQHPNIMHFEGVYETDEHSYALVMEMATGGELFEKIQAQGSFTEAKAANITRQVLEALQHMHALRIAHRDLKPENILFKDRTPDAPVKLIDFGFAKRSSSPRGKSMPRCSDEETRKFPAVARGGHVLSTRLGSPNYVAPEILQPRRGYGVEVDIWSLGVILYIMLCGYFPFYHDNEPELYRQIRSGKFAMPEEDWGHVSPAAKDFVCSMLTPDPRLRATASECLKHPWIAKPGVASRRPFPQASIDRLNIYIEESAAPRYQKLLEIVRGESDGPLLAEIQGTTCEITGADPSRCNPEIDGDCASASCRKSPERSGLVSCCVLQ